MRERLITLLKSRGVTNNPLKFVTKELAEHLADYLLANGVIVPPCKIGTHLWRVTHPYRQEPKVTEFVVKNFKTVGKKHRLQIEVQAVNVPATNWMYYHQFHTSREDAEKELYEKQHTQERDL